MADFRPTQWPPEKWLPEKGPSPYKMGLRQILDREGETAVPTGWQPYMSLEMDVPPPQIAKYTIYFQCWKAKSWRHSSWLGTLHLPNVEASSSRKVGPKRPLCLKIVLLCLPIQQQLLLLQIAKAFVVVSFLAQTKKMDRIFYHFSHSTRRGSTTL